MRLGQKHSIESKEKMSKNHADFKKYNNPFYGRKHTKKTKIEISDAMKGQKAWNKGEKLSEKHRRNLSISNEGQIPWCKGLTKETDERVKKIAENKSRNKKISIAIMGKNNPKTI